MSSAICLNQKLNEAEIDIAPQMKKMKLNNSNSSAPESDIIMSNLVSSDPLENLKTAFPSISENVIFFLHFFDFRNIIVALFLQIIKRFNSFLNKINILSLLKFLFKFF